MNVSETKQNGKRERRKGKTVESKSSGEQINNLFPGSDDRCFNLITEAVFL